MVCLSGRTYFELGTCVAPNLQEPSFGDQGIRGSGELGELGGSWKRGSVGAWERAAMAPVDRPKAFDKIKAHSLPAQHP